jgi:uncharacterized membrane protein
MTQTGVAQRTSTARIVAVCATFAGLAISGYLTAEHYTHGTGLACPETATINCLKVTTSKWSAIAGVPVAVLGFGYFVIMMILVAIPHHEVWLDRARIVGAGVGVASVLYLVYIELFEVDAICLWCTVVHLMTLILFGAVLWDSLGRHTGLR